MKLQRGNVGISFLGMLALLFIGLKLGGVITWSWWFVLLPLYGGFVLIFVIFFIAAIIAARS